MCGLHYPGLVARVKFLSITAVKRQPLLLMGEHMPGPALRAFLCQSTFQPRGKAVIIAALVQKPGHTGVCTASVVLTPT